MSKDIYVKALVRIPKQRIIDMITTAVEGGCNYWAKFKFPDNWKNNDESHEQILFKSGHIEVYDVQTDELVGHLNKVTIRLGLQLMGQRKDIRGKDIPLLHFKNVISDNMDAETADVFVQLAVMG
ncbi:MAG: hypothetical protein ACYS8S_06695, partial [Planctomycetota bacterium]